MKRSLFTLLLLFPALLALSRSIMVERPDQDTRKEGWRYTLKVNNRGTRSEGWTGTLYWQNLTIPARFHELSGPLGHFQFVEGKHLWGEHGWIRRGERLTTATAGQLRPNERNRGWYAGKARKRLTPATWVAVARDNAWYWVDPGKLAALASAQGWSTLKAHGWRDRLGD